MFWILQAAYGRKAINIVNSSVQGKSCRSALECAISPLLYFPKKILRLFSVCCFYFL